MPRNFAARNFCVRLDRFGERIEDGHARIQRGVGVLKNHLKIRARVAQLGAAKLREILILGCDKAALLTFGQ